MVNTDKIDIKRMIFDDDLDGCIKFIEPDFVKDNLSKSIVEKAIQVNSEHHPENELFKPRPASKSVMVQTDFCDE